MKLNPDKEEMLLVGPNSFLERRMSSVLHRDLQGLRGNQTQSLGVLLLDSALLLDVQVREVTRAAIYQTWLIRQQLHLIQEKQEADHGYPYSGYVHALQYCNVLYMGQPVRMSQKLLKILQLGCSLETAGEIIWFLFYGLSTGSQLISMPFKVMAMNVKAVSVRGWANVLERSNALVWSCLATVARIYSCEGDLTQAESIWGHGKVHHYPMISYSYVMNLHRHHEKVSGGFLSTSLFILIWWSWGKTELCNYISIQKGLLIYTGKDSTWNYPLKKSQQQRSHRNPILKMRTLFNLEPSQYQKKSLGWTRIRWPNGDDVTTAARLDGMLQFHSPLWTMQSHLKWFTMCANNSCWTHHFFCQELFQLVVIYQEECNNKLLHRTLGGWNAKTSYNELLLQKRTTLIILWGEVNGHLDDALKSPNPHEAKQYMRSVPLQRSLLQTTPFMFKDRSTVCTSIKFNILEVCYSAYFS